MMKELSQMKNYIITVIFISTLFIIFKPLIVQQIIIRGDGYLGFDMHRDAIRQYKKALFLEPKNVEAKNWLAYAYSKAGDRNKAVRTYEDSLRLTPDNIVAHYELGMFYAKEKKYEKAKRHFSKALSIPKEDAVLGGEDYDFYYQSVIKMLKICQDRISKK